MHVLVIGATGFIGRRLVRTLTEGDHVVYALARHADHGLCCDTRLWDGADLPQIRSAVENWPIDAIVNLAAAGVHPGDRDASRLVATNSVLPAVLVELADSKAARCFIQIGSSAEYARAADHAPIPETSALERSSLYGASKAAGSLITQATGKLHDVAVAVLRPFNIFGPGEKPHRLLPSLVARLSKGEVAPLSPGLQMRDFLYVDDACAAIRRMIQGLAAEPALAGEYNLGSGAPCTVADFARAVAHALGADPALLDFGRLPLRADDLPYVVAATEKLDKTIGKACLHSLQEALDLCVRQMPRISRS